MDLLINKSSNVLQSWEYAQHVSDSIHVNSSLNSTYPLLLSFPFLWLLWLTGKAAGRKINGNSYLRSQQSPIFCILPVIGCIKFSFSLWILISFVSFVVLALPWLESTLLFFSIWALPFIHPHDFLVHSFCLLSDQKRLKMGRTWEILCPCLSLASIASSIPQPILFLLLLRDLSTVTLQVWWT